MEKWREEKVHSCVSSNKIFKKNYYVTIKLESDIKLTCNMI